VSPEGVLYLLRTKRSNVSFMPGLSLQVEKETYDTKEISQAEAEAEEPDVVDDWKKLQESDPEYSRAQSKEAFTNWRRSQQANASRERESRETPQANDDPESDGVWGWLCCYSCSCFGSG